jgi:hypothetical protein
MDEIEIKLRAILHLLTPEEKNQDLVIKTIEKDFNFIEKGEFISILVLNKRKKLIIRNITSPKQEGEEIYGVTHLAYIDVNNDLSIKPKLIIEQIGLL